jgi:hypothetical protein
MARPCVLPSADRTASAPGSNFLRGSMAGLKTQWSRCVTRRLELWKYYQGFFADQLHDVLVALPAWLWPDKRRKRTYLNQVLARAESGSTYRPARKLWVRARNGYYLPNPAMQLRVGDSWVPVDEALALAWIDRAAAATSCTASDRQTSSNAWACLSIFER